MSVALLQSLKGAELVGLTPTDFALNVTDPAEWDANIRQLADAFWPLIKEAYDRPDEELERQLQLTFENAKNVYVRLEEDLIVGFCSLGQHDVDPKVGIVRDIIVAAAKRGNGLSRDLYSLMFSQHAYDAMIGVSVTLAAIKMRIATSEKHGFRGYYGSMGSGDPEVERLRKLNDEYMLAKRMSVEQRLPPGNEGFVLLQADVLPPLHHEDTARLDPSSPLFSEARRILELQRGYADGQSLTVAGHLINVRKFQ